MINFFGENLEKEDLLKLIGNISNIAGTTVFRYLEGRATNLKGVSVKNGSGLNFIVLPDRGMDIGNAEYLCKPISWISKCGIVSPYFYEKEDSDFLRTFTGGLLTTCGLTQAGTPCIDNGIIIEEKLGLHGRISHIPAEKLNIDEYWDDDDYITKIRGRVRQSCVYEENLVLEREISTKLSNPVILIKDLIINEGYNKSPLMLLYHFNFGYPIVSKHTKLFSTFRKVEPLNDYAKCGNGVYDRFFDLKPDYKPDNFAFFGPKNSEQAIVALINNKINLGIYIKFSPRELPYFTEWIMLGLQDYVVGLEPGNCLPEGRTEARKNGRLEYICPGEKKSINLEIGIVERENEIKLLINELNNNN